MKNKEKLKEVSARIASKAKDGNDSFSIDPFTIMAICNCIISVVKLLYMCYSKKGIASAIKKRSYLHTILLKREIRKNFRNKKQRKITRRCQNEEKKNEEKKE